ncbi:MAG: porin [Hydrogenophaga sp.]|nr:porin [Hydrogenophaga sp.]
MKKSLIALAVLAASGAALAQSSVTIYGRVDTSVGSIKDTGSAAANKNAVTSMFSDGKANLTASRWGFRGTEDLGGGLKAGFQLESRFFTDTGALDGVQFKGASFLSLSGGFGEVRLGRSTTVYDDVRALSYSSNLFDSGFTPASNGVFSSGGDYNSRFDNKITYLSPSMGGFYAGVDLAFDEDASKKADKMALKAGYRAGPMHFALGYQDEKTIADYTALSGSYDFGVASVSAGFNMRDSKTSAAEDTEYTVGVNVPVGAVALSAGFASSKTEVGSATTGKASGFGLGATYTFSKRTKAYVGYRAVEVKNNVGTKTKDETLYAVGVRHDF